MKKFNIILEGCDGVGKTTVFDMMLKRGLFQIGLHTGPPKSKEECKHQIENIIEALNRQGEIIMDRFSLSECVYSPMIRNYYPEYMRELEKKIESHNVLVLLYADLPTIKRRFDGEVLRMDQLEECLQRYEREFKECNYEHKIRVNTGVNKPEQVIELILNYVEEVLNDE